MSANSASTQIIYGTSKAEIINGTSGSDSIIGLEGNDIIYGFDGPDILTDYDNSGDDFYDGGAGVDTIYYGAASSPINIDLKIGKVVGQTTGTDTLLGIEKITATLFADIVYGNDDDNEINGLGGADLLAGRGGNDTYGIIDLKSDIVELPGQGLDTVIFAPKSDSAYTLPDNVENLFLNGLTNSCLVGNSLDNYLVGGVGNDLINGASGNDKVTLTSGRDIFVGGDGFDTLLCGVNRSIVTVSKLLNNFVELQHYAGSDSLFDFEKIQFTDGSLVYDLLSTTNNDNIYRLYKSSFGRVPDEVGFRYWVSESQNGAVLNQISSSFMGSPEFQSLYGVNVSNKIFIDLLYQNVFNRKGEPDGVAWWNTQLDNHLMTRDQALISFSNSPENILLTKANVENGYWLI